MKKLLYIICCLLFISCAKEELKKPDFIAGYWIRLNDKPTQKTYEIWNTDFTGIGFTMEKSDTVFKEILSIIEKKDTLYLQVEGVNEEPTLFKFTNQTSTSFTCENPINEFPKKIKYYMESDTLKARVSNEEFSIEFVFMKSF
tara:strand:+ start:3110 stop:3538 length:429 start_codon:yes stop_codon:yes gene_type:complete